MQKFIINFTIFFLIVFGIYKCCDEFSKNCWHFQKGKERTSKIFSLRTSSETKGNFILGIGSISGYDYYVFYRKTSSGGLIREKLLTSNCIIYEGNYEPMITESGTMGYHLSDGDTVLTTFEVDDFSNRYHSIYVPKGTITERITNLN